MAMIESQDAGQEKHSAQLGQMVAKIQDLEKEKQALQTRLDGVLASITRSHDEVFGVEKTPNKY